jgi:hypothetical protein
VDGIVVFCLLSRREWLKTISQRRKALMLEYYFSLITTGAIAFD